MSAVRHTSVLGIALALMTSAAAHAHSGGLDADGCHHNRKTGDYHCHRAAATPRPADADAGAASASRPFRNCSEARAAGAAPVRAGEPGYGPHLDRDGDGIGCEPFRRR